VKVYDLNPNPRNPRKISDQKLEMLKRAIEEFGDLSGIVYNRRTRQLVGGHQRSKVFNSDAEILIERVFETPTKSGTVAEGYIVVGEDRFQYREVDWDEVRERAANIAANKHGGEWNYSALNEWLLDLDQNNFDMDLVGFSHEELIKMLVPDLDDKAPEGKPEPKEKRRIACPSCGESFSV
jgi:hypothetical protein